MGTATGHDPFGMAMPAPGHCSWTCWAALAEAHAGGETDAMPLVTGGRYGLSSKGFTPGMVAGISPCSPASTPAPGSLSASPTT